MPSYNLAFKIFYIDTEYMPAMIVWAVLLSYCKHWRNPNTLVTAVLVTSLCDGFCEICWQVDSQRYVVKHGLIVEKIAKERKLRHVFLFNDILVVAKQKVVNRFVYKLQYYTTVYYSVTAMLLELGLPSFDTLLYNNRMRFANQVQRTNNSIIAQLRLIF